MEELHDAICSMPWCRAPFKYRGDVSPSMCGKCQSFDTELSGGVTWTEKNYEGSRMDGNAHPISINVNRAIENKKFW